MESPEKALKKMQDTVKSLYLDQALISTQKSGERWRTIHFGIPKKIRAAAFITDPPTAIEKDRQVMIRKLALAPGVLLCTIQNVLHKDMSLAKNYNSHKAVMR
jgi:hypothetical protein